MVRRTDVPAACCERRGGPGGDRLAQPDDGTLAAPPRGTVAVDLVELERLEQPDGGEEGRGEADEEQDPGRDREQREQVAGERDRELDAALDVPRRDRRRVGIGVRIALRPDPGSVGPLEDLDDAVVKARGPCRRGARRRRRRGESAGRRERR
jgi:hypothetical protein